MINIDVSLVLININIIEGVILKVILIFIIGGGRGRSLLFFFQKNCGGKGGGPSLCLGARKKTTELLNRCEQIARVGRFTKKWRKERTELLTE